MKKSILSFFCIFILLFNLAVIPADAATGTASLKADISSVKVGEQVKLTITYTSSSVGGGVAFLKYDDKVFGLDSLSGSGTYNSDAAGLIKYTFADSSKKSSYSFTCTFKAKQAGSCKFELTSQDLITFDEEPFTVGVQSVSVTATNPTLSANANLASIKPSSGTLTPKFSPNVTNYTISVPYTTTSLTLSVTTQDKGAKTSVSGKNTLAVGKNTQVITVTAPRGATKKYPVVINRSANQTTTTNGTGTTTTTTTAPQEDPLEVEVGGVMMTVSDTQPDASLPDGFKWTHITINNISVSAAVNEKTNITLVYLIDPQSENAAFYIYDEVAETFAAFRPLAVSGGNYILREMPTGLTPPARAVKGVYTFGSTEHTVYQFEDTALEDIVLVYATSPAGKTGLFVYDTTDGSMQLYREITAAADTAPQPTQPVQDNAFAAFVKQYRPIILIGAVALGGVALATVAIVLIVAATRKGKNCKH